MEGGTDKLLNKTLSKNEREMKKVADATDPPAVIEIVLITVDIHVTLVVVPPVEGEHLV